MEEWKEYKLSEVLDKLIDYRGKTPKKNNHGVPLITAKIIKDGRIEKPNEFIALEDYDSWMVRGIPEIGDVVLTTEAPLGEVAQLQSSNVALAQRVVTLRGKKGILDNTYLKYYFISPFGHQRLLARETGTTVTGIKQSELREVPVVCPPFAIQRQIASILSSLDNKIELNRRINENLEAQAQALFKSWFVDFEPFRDGEFVESELGMIPKGWRVGKLGDACKCVLGGTPSRNKDEYWNGDIAWINSGEVNEFRITKPSEYITKEGLENSATKLLPKKTTVLAITGATLGQVSLLEIESCANQSVIGVLENEMIPYEFIYPLINESIKVLISNMTGGAQQHINKNNVEQLDIIIPDNKTILNYKNILQPIYAQIGINCFESRRLATLRDTLLPRLMSGELKVNEKA